MGKISASFHRGVAALRNSARRRPNWLYTLLVATIIAAAASSRTIADEPAVEKSPAAAKIAAAAEQGEPVVTVFGKPITREYLVKQADSPQKQAIHLCHLVYARLQPHYAKAKGILPTDEEVKPAMDRYLKHANKDGREVTEEQIKQMIAIRPEMSKLFAYGQILEWKTCKSLWKEHGGNVGLGSLGMWLPFEGRRALFKKHHAAGDIKFHDDEVAKQFWAMANDVTDENHTADTVVKDQERIAKYFAKPPWEMQE